jgi:mRNA interferase MazF
MVVKQYDVYLISLDPTIGHEVKKSRPCVIISPDAMNMHLQTVIIAPMTTKSHSYPTRVKIHFKGKGGYVVLDQIRTVDKLLLIKHLGTIKSDEIIAIKEVIREMLVE